MKAGRLIWNTQDFTRMRTCTEVNWSGIFFIIVFIGRTVKKKFHCLLFRKALKAGSFKSIKTF